MAEIFSGWTSFGKASIQAKANSKKSEHILTCCPTEGMLSEPLKVPQTPHH